MPGDKIDIQIDRDGDGEVDHWATKHLTVGAVGHTPEEVRQLRRRSGKRVSAAAKVAEMGTGLYSVTYTLAYNSYDLYSYGKGG